MSARDGLYEPPEPEWLRRAVYEEGAVIRALREPEPEYSYSTLAPNRTGDHPMPDEIVVTGEAGFAPAPEGQYLSACVDVIDLGERMESFQGGTPKLTRKVALVFQIDEVNPDTGRRYEMSVEKTLAFGQTAGLRKFLGQWRGKQYTDAEASAGVPLHKLVGVNAIVQIEHRTSGKGRIYANISNIMPPAKNMPKLTIDDYQRSDHWTRRRTDYADEVQKWRTANVPQASTAVTRNGQPTKQVDQDLTKPLPVAVTGADADDGLPF